MRNTARGEAVSKDKRGWHSRLAVVSMAAAMLGACVPTATAGHDAGRLYSFAELEQHVAEHLRPADAGDDEAMTVAAAKADALARLARVDFRANPRPNSRPPSGSGGPRFSKKSHKH